MILTHFNQLLSTSGAEFADHLCFISRDSHNIVTTANNTLKIYEIDIDSNTPSAKLILRREYQLHGEIIGIQSIKILSTTEDGKDRLLIAFRDAKVIYIYLFMLFRDSLNNILDCIIRMVR